MAAVASLEMALAYATTTTASLAQVPYSKRLIGSNIRPDKPGHTFCLIHGTGHSTIEKLRTLQ